MIAYILFKIKKHKVMLPTVIVTSILTMIFIYVIGTGFSQPYVAKIAIVDLDRSATSMAITRKLKEYENYEFTEQDLDLAKKKLEGRRLAGIVYIDQGFEAGLAQSENKITFYRNGVNVETMFLENSLSQYISEAISDNLFPAVAASYLPAEEALLRSKFEELRTEYVTYEVDSGYYEKDTAGYSQYKYYFAGFLLFFSMFTIMFGIGSLVEEKEIHVWQRQMVSPLRTSTILIGDLISNFILGMGQMTLVVLVSKYLFRIEWGGSTLAILLVLAAYVFAGTALGLFVSCFVRTEQQLGAFLPTVVVATSMIGGTMWPREMTSNKVLLMLSDVLPQRWAMKGLLDVIMYNGGLKNVLQPILYLLIITAVLIIASLKPYRKVA